MTDMPEVCGMEHINIDTPTFNKLAFMDRHKIQFNQLYDCV